MCQYKPSFTDGLVYNAFATINGRRKQSYYRFSRRYVNWTEEGGVKMAKEPTKDYRWSAWHPFDTEVVNTSVPDKPGVYEVRSDVEFGRLKGSSPLVTIGSAVASLRKRLCEQRFPNTTGYLKRVERWPVRASYTLEFRSATNRI